ncbi:hypothetical protein [Amycolatopsis sp.]|uniref:hypothetical protein n=1 Tax=Amycolatopsis sp. TaxID=37632 RepID=UPI002D7EDB3A|nr:hypothetical protein [Amycolatopsis sp.]HET6708974.1 hypothetical protein [Amycolatopsis sp.]
MTLKERVSSIGRTAKISFAALALVGGFASAAPATANAAPAAIQSADGVQASWSCTYTLGYYRADAYCNIYSGAIRLRSYCSGYGYIATGYFQNGYVHLSTDCYPYQRTGSWIDSIG